MYENYDDDDEMYAASSADLFGRGMGLLLLLSFIAFVITIVATVKASKGPKTKTGGMPGPVIAMVVISWLTWFFQVPLINVVVPATLIHAMRYPTGNLRRLVAV